MLTGIQNNHEKFKFILHSSQVIDPSSHTVFNGQTKKIIK